jgi:hypothetical protein
VAEPRFDRLVALLPLLESRAEGAAGELVRVVHEDGIMPDGFDWPAWKADGERYVEPAGVEGAELKTCRRLLTVIVRQDRFVEGSLLGHVQSGLAARIVRRITELVDRGMDESEVSDHD